MFNPHPCQSLLMMNQNSKSPKPLTPRLTTINVHANYCILSIGQVMRALMKKLCGYLLLNWDMLLNSLWTSILLTWPSLAFSQVIESGVIPSFGEHAVYQQLFIIIRLITSFLVLAPGSPLPPLTPLAHPPTWK